MGEERRTGLSEKQAEAVVRGLEYVGNPRVATVIMEASLVAAGAFIPPEMLRPAIQTGADMLKLYVRDFSVGDDLFK